MIRIMSLLGNILSFIIRHLPRVITYTALLGISLWGWPGERAPMTPIPQYPSVASVFEKIGAFIDASVAIPWLLILVTGFFLGDVGWPFLRELVAKAEATERFISERRALETRRAVFKYFKHLGRAYHKWCKSDDGGTINEFINKLDYPPWLKGEIKSLSDAIAQNIEKSPPHEWQFFLDLYEDFEDVIERGAKPKYLKAECDYEDFHLARQDLIYFWERTAEKLYERKTLHYNSIKDKLIHDRRVIISLCFVSVALFKQNKQFGEAKTLLYKLGAQVSEERP